MSYETLALQVQLWNLNHHWLLMWSGLFFTLFSLNLAWHWPCILQCLVELFHSLCGLTLMVVKATNSRLERALSKFLFFSHSLWLGSIKETLKNFFLTKVIKLVDSANINSLFDSWVLTYNFRLISEIGWADYKPLFMIVFYCLRLYIGSWICTLSPCFEVFFCCVSYLLRWRPRRVFLNLLIVSAFCPFC